MKKHLLIAGLLINSLVYSQQAEKVYSITKEVREISWYETQQKLWKAEIDKNKTNADAWYNYFSATRALKNLSYTDETGVLLKKYQEQCNQIADDALKTIPNTFEANHIKFWNGDLMKESAYLFKANEISPNDPRAFDGMMVHYELDRNKMKFEEFAGKCFKSNGIPGGILNWAHNLLAEVDKNAVILTFGDNDTYAAWIVQGAKQFRKDVTIINTSLIMIEEYRTKLFKELGYPELTINETDDWDENHKKVLQHIFNGSRPSYVSATGVGQLQDQFGEKLFVTGLAYKYSESTFDNISIIQRNYEKRYLLDHLKETFTYNISDKKLVDFNSTYLPSLLKLYKHYQESEESLRMAELEKLIISISEESGQQSEIYEILVESTSSPALLTALLDVKSIEKNMLPVNKTVYMGKYEVSNADYRKFLDNLKRSQQTNLLAIAQYDSTVWNTKFQYTYNDPMRENYHWHPAYDEYPMVNISFEAAQAYCDWLTKQYNTQRKREYTQVKFRLPSEKEWLLAAGSGNEKAVSCFPNDNIQNADKCYLGNIKVSPGRYMDDGAFHTAKVSSYLANKAGFFCTFGNVAEMIDKKGIAKGGSWYHTFEESNFQQQINYAGPDPGIGFRIVMEIIEQ
jgi:hypothetical protein